LIGSWPLRRLRSGTGSSISRTRAVRPCRKLHGHQLHCQMVLEGVIVLEPAVVADWVKVAGDCPEIAVDHHSYWGLKSLELSCLLVYGLGSSARDQKRADLL